MPQQFKFLDLALHARLSLEISSNSPDGALTGRLVDRRGKAVVSPPPPLEAHVGEVVEQLENAFFLLLLKRTPELFAGAANAVAEDVASRIQPPRLP